MLCPRCGERGEFPDPVAVFPELEWATAPELPPRLHHVFEVYAECGDDLTRDAVVPVLRRHGIDSDRHRWWIDTFRAIAAVDADEASRSMDPELKPKDEKR